MLFLAEITNLNVFTGQKQQLFPPIKIPRGARNKSGTQKRKSGGTKTKIGGAMPPCPPFAGDAPALRQQTPHVRPYRSILIYIQ